MVEPLPLVPAIWITGGNVASGWSSRASRRCTRSRLRSMRFGCKAASRAINSPSGWGLAAGRFTRGAQPARLPAPRRSGPEPAQPRQRRAHLVAMHDHVDHAVIEQIFRALESFRQFLADGLLDDA